MSLAPIEPPSGESSASASASSNSVSQGSMEENRRFDGLRSVKWRINLGILPSSYLDDLRRVTADSRRRYARLRRRLLVDPHILKEGNNSSDVVMDNPLSQNPDSTWGRFFRNAELEKMVDQDLSRLYPEHGSYFQTAGCQGMLRRILLLWCLRHSEFGYRQGMHELLAPLLYVLHVDVERLFQVRKLYADHFTDKFDDLSLEDDDLTYNFNFRRSLDYMEDKVASDDNASKARSLEELDTETQTMILLTDAYGTEGELGIVISEKFMEHDAFCMFDALMSGANGAVAMAEFFSPSPAGESLPPVIEASAALYHLLSLVDSSLHSHLVELGVEPQYFALRWLRVLFGREFSLGNLLIIWDEIFASENGKLDKVSEDEGDSSFGVLCSPRGAFISAMAVSMLLYLRSSLLATEHATQCLQRLLNFPDNVDLKKLLEKAKSLQALALTTNISSSSSYSGTYGSSKSKALSGRSESFDTVSPNTPLSQTSVSYWEEKWRVHLREEELRQGSLKKHAPTQKKGWTEKVKLRISRTESDPTSGTLVNSRRNPKSSVRRRLLEDLSQELGLEEDIDTAAGHEASDDGEKHPVEVEDNREDVFCKDVTLTSEDRCLSGNAGSEESSSIFSDPASPRSGTNDHENDSEKNSVASNLFLDENDNDNGQNNAEEPPLPISHPPDDVSQKSDKNDPMGNLVSEIKEGNLVTEIKEGNSVSEIKERKPLSAKFQWLWKFGRNPAGEGTAEKGGNALEATKTANDESNLKTSDLSTADGSSNFKGDTTDQHVMGTLKNLGNSMLEHIQVIESVFQQDRGAQVGSLENFSKNILVGKGQVTAMAALKELRKISNLLSEM